MVFSLEDLPPNWVNGVIEDSLELILDYRGKTPEKSASGVKTLSARSVKNGRIDYSQVYFISEQTFKEWEKRGKPKPGDVLLTTEGPLGEVAQLGKERVALAQRLLGLRGKEKELDNSYLKHFLMSPFGRQELSSRASGTTVQGIKQSEFRKITLVKPPFLEQLAIAHILSTLDAKIELNERMNRTLEAVGQALFKRWFVDFEFPNQEGKPYKSTGGKMVYSEAGEIPKDWTVGCLADITCNVRKPANPEEVEPEMPYIGLEHMPRKSIALSDWGYAKNVSSNKFFFNKGDILFGKLRPYFHKVGTAPTDGVCSTDILVVNAKQPEMFGLALFHLSSTELVTYAEMTSTGTKMPRTSWKDISKYQIIIPQKQIMEKFTNIISPMVERIISNVLESRTLGAIRDLLLPKLMSGKIRVPLDGEAAKQ